ncbi:MAG: carboxypeptidase-like regulatory domain-containing protein [Opitutaceae bacterium]|nr:carboxypeptidase-like regulatory domain-containing protein [Opitutaceae bacterium]
MNIIIRWRMLATVLLIGSCLLQVPGARAQTNATGTIAGHVYSPATREFVRSAEVKLVGTNEATTTESDGSFRFHNVPPGPVTLAVSYSGYNTVHDTFTVAAGQTAVREINVVSSLAGRSADGDVVKLGQFVVESEREGNAKAIMDQRRNMNVSTSLAADVYGDLTDGNVGEFLKFMPGLDIEYIQSEARGVRIGGMDSEYAGFSVDGVKLASAEGDPNFGGGTHARGEFRIHVHQQRRID